MEYNKTQVKSVFAIEQEGIREIGVERGDSLYLRLVVMGEQTRRNVRIKIYIKTTVR